MNSSKVNQYSGYRGVSLDRRGRHKGRIWRVVITLNGVQTDIGTFATPEEAARIYDKAARELHGEFATLNFPQESHG